MGETHSSIHYGVYINYSTQTVYNYRQKIKKSTAIPEDQFEAEVEKLMKSPAYFNASPI